MPNLINMHLWQEHIYLQVKTVYDLGTSRKSTKYVDFRYDLRFVLLFCCCCFVVFFRIFPQSFVMFGEDFGSDHVTFSLRYDDVKTRDDGHSCI